MNMTMLWSIYRNDHHGLLQSITILLVSQSPQGLKETLHGNTPRMYVCHICLPPQGKMLMRIRNQTWPGNWKSIEIPYQKMEVFHGKIIVSLGGISMDFPWKVRSRIQCLRSARAVLAESRRAQLTGGVVWCLEQLTCQVFSGGCSRKLVNQPHWKRKWTIKKAFDQWISMNNGCDFVQTWELLHLFWPFQRGLTWLVTDKPQLSAKLNWFQGRDRRVQTMFESHLRRSWLLPGLSYLRLVHVSFYISFSCCLNIVQRFFLGTVLYSLCRHSLPAIMTNSGRCKPVLHPIQCDTWSLWVRLRSHASRWNNVLIFL